MVQLLFFAIGAGITLTLYVLGQVIIEAIENGRIFARTEEKWLLNAIEEINDEPR